MYNTVQDLHVALDQALQYVNSNRKNALKIQEKDWLLNETQYRLIDNIIDKRKIEGYDDSQLSYDALKPLKKSVNLPVIISSNGVGYAILPDDYLHRDRVDAFIEYTCENTINDTETVISYWELCLPVDSASPAYVDFKIQYDDGSHTTTLYDIHDYPNLVTSLNTGEARFMLIQHVLDILKDNDKFEVYWEHYNNIYKAGCFIFVAKDIPSIYYTFTITYVGSKSKSLSPNTITVSLFDRTGSVLKPTALKSTEEITDLLVHPFGRTMAEKPLITQVDERINVYWNNAEFVITNIVLSYIKQPRFINKLTNQMTELKNISDAIVQLTVQNIKAKLNDTNYQAIINENMQNK